MGPLPTAGGPTAAAAATTPILTVAARVHGGHAPGDNRPCPGQVGFLTCLGLWFAGRERPSLLCVFTTLMQAFC